MSENFRDLVIAASLNVISLLIWPFLIFVNAPYWWGIWFLLVGIIMILVAVGGLIFTTVLLTNDFNNFRRENKKDESSDSR